MKTVEVHGVTLEAASAVAEAGKAAQVVLVLHQVSPLSQHRLRFLREPVQRFRTRNILPEVRSADRLRSLRITM